MRTEEIYRLRAQSSELIRLRNENRQQQTELARLRRESDELQNYNKDLRAVIAAQQDEAIVTPVYVGEDRIILTGDPLFAFDQALNQEKAVSAMTVASPAAIIRAPPEATKNKSKRD